MNEPLTYDILRDAENKIYETREIKTFLLPSNIIQLGLAEGIIEKIDGKMYFTTEGFRGIEIFADENLTDQIIELKD